MTLEAPLELSGAPGSPYTRKMLAVLRYRRIPYRLFFRGREPAGYPTPKAPLLPTFYLDGQAVTDSTPLIRRFDAAIPERRVRPADPALAFLDSLIEDYADEWLTKCMFHYRWAHAADAAFAGRLLPSWGPSPLDEPTLGQMARMFSERQIGRLGYVGSNPTTGPVIEDSYVRLLDALEAHLSAYPFLLGGAPGAGDFGLFGQLTQLAGVDPTPTAIAQGRAHRVMGWVGMVEDLSGLEPEALIDPGDPPNTLKALLAEMGRVYAPLLAANAKAVMAGAKTVETRIDGRDWVQNAFPYQAKCLGWLREEHAALPASAKTQVDAAIAGTGWETLF
ncbi:MAG TPA: glutathione S-transferase N-terminal domain-containing protein [Caulobacter sp.]|nr:glutathione S-transferase N-terminal domain-containing protein [Caulobacter sp.]